MERIRRLMDTLRHIGARPIAMALAVLLISAGIAGYTGVHIHSMEKEVLRQRGELNAKASAMEYNRYLITRVNIVTLVGYTVDEMIASGEDNRAVERYLTEQTGSIIATLDPGTTGLYGWIRGEYLDGAGWVPDEGYVATERPWYVQTLASERDITFVEPYLDMQTGTVMMTVATLLRDGESVLAMDVSLAPIQKIVGQVAAATEGGQALVLDESGIVVIHSDEAHLGHNSLDNPEGLCGIVAQRLLRGGEMQFDVKTEEGSFSVYVDELEGGWYSVSLINADVWYRPLDRAMLIFYIILAFVALFLLLVFLRLNEKNLTLEKLYARIDREEKRGEKLQELSETDRMTGLNDRVNGEKKVARLLASGVGGMFLELDVDHFKSINDGCGHQAGDAVIRAVADAMRGTFRTNDVTMRLGGDEFGVFAVGIVDRDMGEAIIRRFFARLDELQVPQLRDGRFAVSVGATLCGRGDAPGFEELYARADSAMYAAKKTEGNSLCFR